MEGFELGLSSKRHLGPELLSPWRPSGHAMLQPFLRFQVSQAHGNSLEPLTLWLIFGLRCKQVVRSLPSCTV